MNHRLTNEKTNPTSTCSMHVLGGQQMTMQEYAAYIQALSFKPFLTAQEASTFFNLGINKMYKLMQDPSCNFVVNKSNKRQYARIHRETFEKWILTHGDDISEEV